jgi:hypothetical protein
VAVWAAILAWWRARQRKIDVATLWPQCLAGANDIDHALLAFTVHAFNDPAWLALGEEELRYQLALLGAAATEQRQRLAGHGIG